MIDIHGRAIRSRIDRWRDAGLIDPATAARLIQFEATGPGARVPTLTVIGALAIALGVVALVSANWDAIPVWAKLGAHVFANLALGLWAHRGIALDRLGHRTREGALTVLSASTLALLAHVGQSFQLQGGPFGLLATWLVLVTPFTLAFARGEPNRWLWTLGLLATYAAGFAEHAEALEERRLIATSLALLIVAGYTAPLALRAPGLQGWGRHLNHVMLGALVLATSAAQLGWRLDGVPDDLPMRADVLTGAAVATAGLLAASLAMGRDRPWLMGFVVASPAYAALPLLVGGADSPALAALAFCLYWAAVAQLAHAAGRADLYRLAVVVIALRVVLIFLEAFGGLLLTGVGLIASGLLLLGFGYAVRRFLRRTA